MLEPKHLQKVMHQLHPITEEQKKKESSMPNESS